MCRPVRTHRFKKDVALARRRGKDLGKLRRILERLIAEEPLSVRHRDHPLIGDDVGRSECHVKPGWLLLYIRSKGRTSSSSARVRTRISFGRRRASPAPTSPSPRPPNLEGAALFKYDTDHEHPVRGCAGKTP
jgi:mRNA interferase YafQ